MQVKVYGTLEESLTAAKKLLDTSLQLGLPLNEPNNNLLLQKDDIVFNDRWDYTSEDKRAHYYYGVIDGRVLVTYYEGAVEVKYVKEFEEVVHRDNLVIL